MANQQVIDRASQRVKTGLEVAPGFFAQIAGALFGVLGGFKLLLGALVADVKKLSSPSGRQQLYYGRQGPKPVIFEGSSPAQPFLQSIQLPVLVSLMSNKSVYWLSEDVKVPHLHLAATLARIRSKNFYASVSVASSAALQIYIMQSQSCRKDLYTCL